MNFQPADWLYSPRCLLYFCLCLFLLARLNYAARHRNVYFDSVGGDPYGKKTTLSSAVNFKTVVIEKTSLAKFNFHVEILVLSV